MERLEEILQSGDVQLSANTELEPEPALNKARSVRGPVLREAQRVHTIPPRPPTRTGCPGPATSKVITKEDVCISAQGFNREEENIPRVSPEDQAIMEDRLKALDRATRRIHEEYDRNREVCFDF